MTNANGRTADYPIDPMFLERWSPRAFTGEPISETELLTMLEAARWAPSSSNAQPWRFVWARRDTAHWDAFLELLVPTNRSWAKHASALVILLSKRTMHRRNTNTEVPSPTHSLDAGTASGYFALQASRMKWLVHGMAGFDRERVIALLNLPANYHVEAIYAVGRPGDPSQLPEALRTREVPSNRVPLTKLAFEGTFNPDA